LLIDTNHLVDAFDAVNAFSAIDAFSIFNAVGNRGSTAAQEKQYASGLFFL